MPTISILRICSVLHSHLFSGITFCDTRGHAKFVFSGAEQRYAPQQLLFTWLMIHAQFFVLAITSNNNKTKAYQLDNVQ